jgi:hypothetical protein
MEKPEVTAHVERLAAMVQPYIKAGDAVLHRVQEIDRKQPQFTAEMRRLGILPLISAYFDACSATFKEYADLLRVLERSYEIEGLSKLTGTTR